jgi:hypothetical protein
MGYLFKTDQERPQQHSLQFVIHKLSYNWTVRKQDRDKKGKNVIEYDNGIEVYRCNGAVQGHCCNSLQEGQVQLCGLLAIDTDKTALMACFAHAKA